jgi:hypothetical protein
VITAWVLLADRCEDRPNAQPGEFFAGSPGDEMLVDARVSGNGGCPRSAASISGGQPAVIEDRADEAAALPQRRMELAFAEAFPKAPLNGLTSSAAAAPGVRPSMGRRRRLMALAAATARRSEQGDL